MAEIQITEMTTGYAADILSWRYPAPYDYYDVTDGDLDYYLDPANFNTRALRVVTSLGFRPVESFAAAMDDRSFEILVRGG
jgi:hypothetical protein